LCNFTCFIRTAVLCKGRVAHFRVISKLGSIDCNLRNLYLELRFFIDPLPKQLA
jgi:hypothetical protein